MSNARFYAWQAAEALVHVAAWSAIIVLVVGIVGSH